MQVLPVRGFPRVKPGDDVAALVVQTLKESGIKLEDGDVLVIAQSVISKAEGRILALSRIRPSARAKKIARKIGKDEREVEIILRESKSLVRVAHVIISETKHGFVCANAGVDKSNVPPGHVSLLPEDPDGSARLLKRRIKRALGVSVAVLIVDTQGRPFRRGCLGFAIGVAGMKPLLDLRGRTDLYGKKLKVTIVSPADAIAAAAVLEMGEADEGVPLVIVRGAKYERGSGSVKELVRRKKRDLFR